MTRNWRYPRVISRSRRLNPGLTKTKYFYKVDYQHATRKRLRLESTTSLLLRLMIWGREISMNFHCLMLVNHVVHSSTPDDDKLTATKWPLLKPSELHMISLSPSTIDFGEVVTKTPCDRSITIVNNYQGDVLVQIKNDQMKFLSFMATSFIVPGIGPLLGERAVALPRLRRP